MWFKPKPGKEEQLILSLAEIAKRSSSEGNPIPVQWPDMDGQCITLFLDGISEAEGQVLLRHEAVFNGGVAAFNDDCPQLAEFGDQVRESTEEYKSQSRIGAVLWEES